MALSLIVTDAGRAALVNAAHDGTAAKRIAQIGISSTAVAASKASANLPGELKRLASLSGDVVAPDIIHMIMRDESADVYPLRSFALYLDDGTLFAVYGQVDVILDKTSAAIGLLALDVQLADIDATQLTFGNTNFLNPPATETVQGVAKLATQALVSAGTDDGTIVTPKKLANAGYAKLNTAVSFTGIKRSGNTVWDAGNDGAGSGLDADFLDGKDSTRFMGADNDVWNASFDGLARLYFAKNGPTYIKVISSIRFQSQSNSDVVTIDEFGNVNAASEISALRFRASSNGDGKAVSIGDDAWVGDVNIPNAIGVRGQQDSTQGFVQFGLGFALGIAGNGRPLTYGGYAVWHAGSDGSGSGLDADMLDGLDSGAFTRVGQDAAQRDMHLDRGDGTGVIYLGNRGDRYLFFDGLQYVFNGAELFANGGKSWTSRNDGSGSGLDADLFDGRDSGSFANSGDFQFGSNGNGFWERRPNGVIECWGTAAVPSGSNLASINITFPIQFTDVGSINITALPTNGANPNWNTLVLNNPSIAVDRAQLTADSANTGQIISAGRVVRWRAIGH